MATLYTDVYTKFLFKVKAYELTSLSSADRENMLLFYLDSACSKFYKLCKTNLKTRDNSTLAFTEDLEDDEIDILSELMITEWLTPQMYSDELLESRLNMKDFNEYSPAKLIEQIRNVYTMSKKNSKRMMIDYSYSHGDIAEVNR